MEVEEKEEVEDKQQELNVKQQELNAKQLEVQAKDEALQALKAKLKNKNQCIDMFVVLCVMILTIMVVVLLNGK
jgi:t-SNARE complex subunit (syntaxin)